MQRSSKVITIKSKDWIEKLNDAIYEADDLFSEFYTEATRRSLVSGNKVVKELHGDNYLKILNKFLGQYGHGINHLDSFKIWEVDAAKM
ncbi:hypothetical protein CMV_023569 [Castanea mollissima]|uniref:Uncharacterized protein n=1 Tax=Castanea mollissima TaxID=60419 RepID=A0A8J4V6R7_9ROSI|nr:hypothetical protein CMV_023569 [Castanea mollissima]